MVMRMSLEKGLHKKLKISDKNIDSPSEGRISDNSITTLKLSKIYEKFRAVDSLTIKVDSGDIFGFLGPNGSWQDYHD